MEIYQGAFFIIAICGIVLLILAVKQHSYLLLNFVSRLLSGTLFIFLGNLACVFLGISISVGINLYTLLTTAILGFPGVILLFGIQIYDRL